MKQFFGSISWFAGVLAAIGLQQTNAQDWPQWRGPDRDGKAAGFSAPAIWPTELKPEWKVSVGQGDATPAVVGNMVYVFTRQGGREIASCLDAATGKQVWQEGYDALPPDGAAARHPGTRSSPAVAQGKMVTYGVRGTLVCWDTGSGKQVWRKDEFGNAHPRFFTSSSPLITGGLCIAQLGAEGNGGILAFDLTSGEQKWKWTGDGGAYSSPVLGGSVPGQMLIALTAKKLVGLNLADGKLAWETAFVPEGRAYNAATPIVQGNRVFYAGAGRGTKAASIEKQGDGWQVKDLWSNTNAVQFNTPVLKNNRLFGIAQNGDLFCIDAQNGATLWTASAPAGRSGFGSIVDAGSVLMMLTPQSELIVFDPSEKEFHKLASYKVADAETYATPVLANRGLYIKDLESLSYFKF